MPTLDNDGCAHVGRKPCRLLDRHIKRRCGLLTAQHRQLGDVRGDHINHRRELQQGIGGIGIQQAVTAGGHHDRIQDHRTVGAGAQPPGDLTDCGCLAEHAEFDRIHGDIGEH